MMETLPCWVQIWNLPLGFIEVEMGRAVGAHIGKVLDVDTRSLEQQLWAIWHEYFNCEDKYNDEAAKNLRVNKYDPWMLVRWERLTNTRKK
ncbi:hypothetical protein LIER_22449 [Lithospermum erythrorhizon]|uniref:DUF4283 domain-containing protein n=1 Tax=Lithospermum erythrorhizon TaxID=34254 RepID=A0AAV3QWG0_LITER